MSPRIKKPHPTAIGMGGNTVKRGKNNLPNSIPFCKGKGKSLQKKRAQADAYFSAWSEAKISWSNLEYFMEGMIQPDNPEKLRILISHTGELLAYLIQCSDIMHWYNDSGDGRATR
jgi:hypothetical protein